MSKTLQEKLSTIQKELKAPKGQRNTFGNYNYRSCEDIVEAVKPLLETAILTLSDEIVMLGNRFYVKATAKITLDAESIEAHGFARESEDKKGMDSAQITGAASSYARKYALNGLFAIDDTKDADTMDNSVKKVEAKATVEQQNKIKTLIAKKGRTWREVATNLNILGTDISKTDANRLLEHLIKLPDAALL